MISIRSLLRRVLGFVVTFLIVAFAMVATVVGAHDMVSALTFSARLGGAAFFVGGLILGVYWLWKDWPPASLEKLLHLCWPWKPWSPPPAPPRAFGYSATTCSAALGLYVFVLFVSRPMSWDWFLPATAILAAAVVGAFSTLRTVGATGGSLAARFPNQATGNFLHTIGSIGVTAGLVFSIFQLWFTTETSPGKSMTTSAVTLSAQLRDDGVLPRDASLHEYTVHYSLKNITGSELLLVRTVYEVVGVKLTSPSDKLPAFGNRVQWGYDIGRYNQVKSFDLLQVGPGFLENRMVGPTEEVLDDRHMEIPTAAVEGYDYVILWVESEWAAADVRTAAAPSVSRPDVQCTAFGGTRCQVTRWPIESPSWLWRIVRGGQELDAVFLVESDDRGSPTRAYLDFCVDRASEGRGPAAACPPNATTRYFERLYKLTWIEERYDLSVAGSRSGS